jgi:hypothetical protein
LHGPGESKQRRDHEGSGDGVIGFATAKNDGEDQS